MNVPEFNPYSYLNEQMVTIHYGNHNGQIGHVDRTYYNKLSPNTALWYAEITLVDHTTTIHLPTDRVRII